MQTRKDLVQAHRLMSQRAAQALVLGEPDNADRPLRRIGIGMFCGLMVGVLLIAGWGIAGLITKDGALPAIDTKTVLIAKSTGTKYVLCGAQHDRLCTVVNFASARLAADGTDVDVKTVATKSLAGFQRGPLIGIPGAPDALPEPGKLVSKPWSSCVSTVQREGNKIPVASLAIGRDLGGTAMSDDIGVIVAAGRQLWLVSAGRRMLLPANLLRPLAQDYQAVQVPPVWLNGLVAGPDFSAPVIPGFGTKRGKFRIGQTFTVEASGASPEQWFVLLRAGLAPITKTEAWLLENSPHAPETVKLSRAAANQAQSRAKLPDRGLPEVPPTIRPYDGGTPLCAVYSEPASGMDRLTLGAKLPEIADTSAVGTKPGQLDQIIMTPGTGVLAGVMQKSDQVVNVTTYVLVTEDGRKFPIAGDGDLAKLGYAKAKAVSIPANLLQLMPQGPVLDARDALKEIP